MGSAHVVFSLLRFCTAKVAAKLGSVFVKIHSLDSRRTWTGQGQPAGGSCGLGRIVGWRHEASHAIGGVSMGKEPVVGVSANLDNLHRGHIGDEPLLHQRTDEVLGCRFLLLIWRVWLFMLLIIHRRQEQLVVLLHAPSCSLGSVSVLPPQVNFWEGKQCESTCRHPPWTQTECNEDPSRDFQRTFEHVNHSLIPLVIEHVREGESGEEAQQEVDG
mmetsp:Transcript_2821/g.17550  ORF Transcript_2821/g.17550 Transcript_2821/m.17550 type:complete len:216 (-) Transcript_2821:900-1547(-)